MAQPIPLQIPPRDPRRELLKRLEQAPAEHAAALLDGYELLERLHQHGVFSLLRGGLTATDKVVETIAAGANSEDSIRAMRNAVLLAKLLASIDPDVLQATGTALGQNFGTLEKLREPPPSIFAILGRLFSRDVRRVLGQGIALLADVGAQLDRKARRAS